VFYVYIPQNEVCTATTIDEMRGGQSPERHSS